MTETQNFLDLDTVKSQMDITDDEYDAQMLPMIESANRLMSLTLLPVLDIKELAETQFWQDAANIAYTYFRALFAQRINNSDEKYKMYKAEYNDSIKVFLDAIKAQPSKDISKRSIIAVGGARVDHSLLRNNYEITDNLGNRLTDRYRQY